MISATQDLLLDAAIRLCKAKRWLDPRILDRDHALREAGKCVSEAKGMLEGVELQIGREKATREEMLREGAR